MIILSLTFTHVFDFYPVVFTWPILHKYDLAALPCANILTTGLIWILGMIWCILLEFKGQVEVRPYVEEIIKAKGKDQDAKASSNDSGEGHEPSLSETQIANMGALEWLANREERDGQQ